MAKFSPQPRSSKSPITLYRSRGDPENLGGLLDGESSEIAQLDDPEDPVVVLFKTDESFVQLDQFFTSRHVRQYGINDRESVCSAATFLCAPMTGMVHQDLAHRPGRHSEEMGTILPSVVPYVNQLQVGLVHEGRGLQRMPVPFSRKIYSGQALQLSVNGYEEDVFRLLVTASEAA